MTGFGRLLLLAACWTALLPAGQGFTAQYNIGAAKVFDLQERHVTAVAVDGTLPGQGVGDVLGYVLPLPYVEKRTPGRLEVTVSDIYPGLSEIPASSPVKAEQSGGDQVRFFLTGEAADRTTVSTVRRKTVKGRDGTIRMRTYLVFNTAVGARKPLPTVVLDAGHGGDDTGAVKNFIREKDINLDIALRAARLFEADGWNVVLTRREDVEPSLLDRADVANIVGADVFISVHNNSLPEDKIPRSREFGTTVLYNSTAVRPAYELASLAQQEIVGALGTQREVLQDRPKLVVLNSTWVPAILTEGIMMTNPANAKMVMDRVQRQRMAEAVLKATQTWRGVKVLAAVKPQPVKEEKKPPVLPPLGNSSANAANHGTVAAKDGWLYYLRRADSLSGEKEETLWRFRPGQFLSDQPVADVEAWDINIDSEWLYFVNWSDGQSIYRSRPDGSEMARLVDGPVQQVSLAGDHIIYVKDRRIQRVRREGGPGQRVADDTAENVVFVDGWIYYANGSDGYRPYRVKPDGTGKARITADETLFMVVAGDWLFYSNLSDGEKLYRVKMDGSQRGLVTDDRSGYINCDSHFIYYSNPSQGNAVFRIKPDGSEKVKLMDGSGPSGPIGIAGGKLYYRGIFRELR